MLSDNAIRKELAAGRIVIDPPPLDRRIQPVSVDVTLGDTWRAYRRGSAIIRPGALPAEDLTSEHVIRRGSGVTLLPRDFLLLTTAEHITLPDDIVAMVHGKSTLGRLGLQVHVTAGLIDPGFRGQITLEAVNLGPLVLELFPGDAIGQVTFERTSSPCDRPYGSQGLGSHYQGQRGATGPAGVAS